MCFSAVAQEERNKAYADPKEVDADFAFQGEYIGEVPTDDGDVKHGVQIIALGKGEFSAKVYRGGLPGDGWDKEETLERDGGRRQGDAVVFPGDDGGRAVIRDGKITVSGNNEFVLTKVERKSPTLGKKPPEGAIVLFDGKSADEFENGRLTEDGLLMQGVTSKRTFNDCELHLEFRLPYMPEARGQGRGNSGLYVHGRYELQMLDSFGLEGLDNECGGFYQIVKPSENMCYPPLAWQTYDIDFTAAKFDASGKKTKNARVTVRHNGVVIHDDLELPKNTPGNLLPENAEPGPIFLQDHGNPVRYRNIWVVEKKS
jgi:hypothetical protein